MAFLRDSQIVHLAMFAVFLAMFAVANFANAENNSLNESLDINPQDRFDDATNHDITPFPIRSIGHYSVMWTIRQRMTRK